MKRCTTSAPFVFAIFAVLLAVSALPAQAQPEFRAFWADAFHSGYKTQAEVDALIQTTRASNCNAIVVQVRKRGDAYYMSSYEPLAADMAPGFDSLAYLVQKAHEGTPRIEIHAWIATLPISASSDPNHPYVKHPDYLSKNRTGELLDGSDYIIDPGHPGALDYTTEVAMDIVRNYDVDGIHLDRVRYGSAQWGYNDVSVARFNALMGTTDLPAAADADWKQWRRDQVTALVRKIYANAIAIKPRIAVSASTITWGDGPSTDAGYISSSSAYTSVFQDWRSWMEEGILDINMPMTYYRDYLTNHQSMYAHWIKFLKDHKYNRHLAVGLGVYLNSIEGTLNQISHARDSTPSLNSTDGILMYSYAVTNDEAMGGGGSPAPNSDFYDALVNPSAYSANPPFPFAVPTPDLTWKTAPTTGHLKGNVTLNSAWVDGATVTIAGPESRAIKTDGTGFYAFIDLLPGNYAVTVTAPAGELKGDVTVELGKVANLDFDFPGPDPVISGLTVSDVTSTGLTVTWTTDIPSASRLEYGITRALGTASTEEMYPTTDHSVKLSSLQPFTPYFLRAVANPSAKAPVYSQIICTMTGFDSDIIVDNDDATRATPLPDGSVWSTGSGAGRYGANYRFCSTSTSGTNSFEWKPNITFSGNYDVYVWYLKGNNRSASAPFTVNYTGGSVTHNVNQKLVGSDFESNANPDNVRLTPVGGVPMAAGGDVSVVLSNKSTASGVVMADAVKFHLIVPEYNPPSVPTGLRIADSNTDRLTIAWDASTDQSGIGGYKIYRDGVLVAISKSGTSFADDGLLTNKSYAYTVSAFDSFGTASGQSAPLTAFTLSPPPTIATITSDKAPNDWMATPDVTFTAVGGFGEGRVTYYRYAWDSNPTHYWVGDEAVWSADAITKLASGSSGSWYLHVIGFNGGDKSNGTLDLGPFLFDDSLPTAPVVTDDGLYTTSRTRFHASWAASGSTSGIAIYKYAVGATPGANDLIDWTDTPLSSVTVTVPRQPMGGKVYFTVKAQNKAGHWGPKGDSDGIMIVRGVSTLLEAKTSRPGEPIMLTTAVPITAAFDGFAYVQDLTVPIGLRVDATGGVVGRLATIGGIMGYDGGERSLIHGQISLQAASVDVRPISLNLRSLGGSALPGKLAKAEGQEGTRAWQWRKIGKAKAVRFFDYVGGPNNVGVLVKVIGRVAKTGTNVFYLDDGSGFDESKEASIPGVRVSVPKGVSVPAKGSVVSLVGISSCYRFGGETYRLLRLRDAASAVILKEP